MASFRSEANHSALSSSTQYPDVGDDDSDGTLLDDDDEDEFVESDSDTEPHRNSMDPLFQRIPTYHSVSDGWTLRPGKTVELHDGDFLRINTIFEHSITTEVVLQGIRYRRNLYLDGILEFKMNEVSMILISEKDDPRDILTQSRVTIRLHEVVKIRELVQTNRPFPALSFRETDPMIMTIGREYTAANGRLVCRYRLSSLGKSDSVLQTISMKESDEGCGTEEDHLRYTFRGDTQRGGSCSSWLDGERDFDTREQLECHNVDLLRYHGRNPNNAAEDEVVDLINRPYDPRRYSFGDAFCGGGGASRGAKGAGLRIEWGFDFNRAAIDTCLLNFWQARYENIAAHEFATIITENFFVDILHLSPPCQPFSPIHVHQGKDDEMNEATFFAAEEILRKTKPRIVTLEETFGLIRTPEKLTWFRALIQIFTKLGFSVRWKVFNLCDFGLPQPRRRLFVMASCPGEALPDWPKPTHRAATGLASAPHLSPFSSVNDAIGHIPKDFSLHNPDQVMRRDELPYDSSLPLKNTITTQGVMCYHPLGKRNFTTRELACLQGFPLEHKFGPKGTRKQIGNAVPPIVAKVFYEHIKQALQKADGLR